MQHRVAIRVEVNATTGEWEWVVFGAPDGTTGIPANQPTITRSLTAGTSGYGKWSMAAYDLNSNSNATTGPWHEDDSADTYTLTLAQLKAASHIRVDTRVTGTGDWTKGPEAEIPGG